MQVETINYCINWLNFKRGYSFFIPCIACTTAKTTVNEAARKLKYRILTKVVIVEGVRGIRVWRL